MQIEENERGGKTVILTAGDNLDKVPRSHRYLLTPPLRAAFANPPAHFLRIMKRCPFPHMARWLGALLSAGRWELQLNRGPGSDKRFSMAGFDWRSDQVRGATIGLPAVVPPRTFPQQLRQHYSLVEFVSWGGFGYGGSLDGLGDNLLLTAFAFDYHGADVDLEQTFVWGGNACGDMLICTMDGRGGWLGLGSHEIRLLGTIGDTIDWVYSELLAGRTPEMNSY
jgi:hypothetical protein